MNENNARKTSVISVKKTKSKLSPLEQVNTQIRQMQRDIEKILHLPQAPWEQFNQQLEEIPTAVEGLVYQHYDALRNSNSQLKSQLGNINSYLQSQPPPDWPGMLNKLDDMVNLQCQLIDIVINFADDRGLSDGGTETTLTTVGKNWGTNIWSGVTLYIFIDTTLYTRKVTSNTNDTLTFDALPTGVVPEKSTKWLLKRDALASGTNTIGYLTSPSTLATGTKSVAAAGTAEAMAASTACKEIIITANDTNTQYIYIGDSNVSSAQYMKRLLAGDEFSISIDNLSKVYLDSDVNGEGVTYGYLN